ncbi:hypothetical protein LEP1GSC133_4078 [Leptospira borgpetersenii serovar Pomona str. 200901868]|uniref:Uncharacterized protein n=1 Tax=Leptospira borgpetersenii serovar Pomona str. 200901868 TaxID=1192866 RepID=M6WMI7_LEPBO|nr:hypothetical protein LEP1GSC133_4078 [Leptospira borgpetersenii serovar Pomona str. 200901868]
MLIGKKVSNFSKRRKTFPESKKTTNRLPRKFGKIEIINKKRRFDRS